MKPIVETMIEYALAYSSEERVADIRIGLGYTAVKLESGKAGVAGILRYRLGQGSCVLLPQAGSLTGIAVHEAISWLRSTNVVHASIGLATLNAWVDWKGEVASKNSDFVQLLHINQNDRVGMVGHIAPVLNHIRTHAQTCFVFDEGQVGQEGITATDRESEILPQCDVVILSATSLINHTFDDLLKHASGAREICLMGPSTPLIPELFRARGLTFLAGRCITDADQILRIVSEAGGTRCFNRVSEKINIDLREY